MGKGLGDSRKHMPPKMNRDLPATRGRNMNYDFIGPAVLLCENLL